MKIVKPFPCIHGMIKIPEKCKRCIRNRKASQRPSGDIREHKQITYPKWMEALINEQN